MKFFLSSYFVRFARRNMCETSVERCFGGLHFFFLHLRALSNLRGRYDLKTLKKRSFWLVTVSFLYTESTVICLLIGPINTLISASYINKL